MTKVMNSCNNLLMIRNGEIIVTVVYLRRKILIRYSKQISIKNVYNKKVAWRGKLQLSEKKLMQITLFLNDAG